MKIIAHRGFSGEYPENTMLSFRKALEAGADGIETDIHLSKDGEVMIIHDEALMRTCGLDGAVFDYTRAELERMNAGRTKDEAFGFTPIPSLEELLSLMAEHKDRLVNIEIKTLPVYYEGIEEKALALVKRAGLEGNIIFSSFNWLSVLKLKKLAPSIRTGFLFSGFPLHNMAPLIREFSVDFFHPDFKDLDAHIVSGMMAGGVGLNVWTVNEREDMKQCLEWGVDSIITNYPDIAIALRGNA